MTNKVNFRALTAIMAIVLVPAFAGQAFAHPTRTLRVARHHRHGAGWAALAAGLIWAATHNVPGTPGYPSTVTGPDGSFTIPGNPSYPNYPNEQQQQGWNQQQQGWGQQEEGWGQQDQGWCQQEQGYGKAKPKPKYKAKPKPPNQQQQNPWYW